MEQDEGPYVSISEALVEERRMYVEVSYALVCTFAVLKVNVLLSEADQAHLLHRCQVLLHWAVHLLA